MALAVGAYSEVLLLHVAVPNLQDESRYLEVRESESLRLAHHAGLYLLKTVIRLKPVLEVHDVLHALDEPWVNLCQLLYALYRVSLLECLRYGEDTEVGRIGQLLVEVLEFRVVVADKAVHALSYHSETLLEHLLERAANGHYLTDRLHRRAELMADTDKLGEVPPWNLAYHIVQLRSLVCRV